VLKYFIEKIGWWNGIILVGAGLLSIVLGAIGTFIMNNNSNTRKTNNNSVNNSMRSMPKKGCGCGLKKH
jgi:hypothetical protein